MNDVGRGDPRSRLEHLFDNHADAVYTFARFRVGADSAADIVSETFLTAWRRIDHVQEPALPWLLGTARRIIANEVRGESRRRALGERLTLERLPTTLAPESAPPEPQATVLAVLERMAPSDREVLVLSAWFELTAQQAAQALGCSAPTYTVRLHRARRRFAVAFSHQDRGGPAQNNRSRRQGSEQANGRRLA